MKEKNTTTEFFDKHAQEYDGFQVAVVPRYEQFISMIAETYRHCVGEGSFLDLGCGSGNVSLKILAESPKSRAFLVDASPTMLEIAMNKIKKRAGESAVIGSKAINLEEREWQRDIEGPFDAAVTAFALEHLEERDYKNVIQKSYELLRKGGVFISLEWSDDEHGLRDWFIKEMEMKGAAHPQYSKYIEDSKAMERHFFVGIREKLSWLAEAGYKNIHTVWQYLGGYIVVGERG